MCRRGASTPCAQPYAPNSPHKTLNAPRRWEREIVEPIVQVAPSVDAPQDWSGFYGGLSLGRALSGDWNFFDYDAGGSFYPAPFGISSGGIYGVFAGYNFQSGNWVYGGELAYTKADLSLETYVGGTAEFTDFFDIKARLGYSFDRFMPYGTIGYMNGNLDNTGVFGFSDIEGQVYGVGVEYKISDRVFAGLEYLRRDIDGKGGTGPLPINLESDIDTLSLHVGMRF
ncbi:outer membrane protein [Phaeovulum veldkampii]|uniref:outer membrane protein n=1 Tax=Phaeovulum veldkampii TaxID=33049 RepID=UPI001F2E4BF8|nr:outer membrane beta-barrel protein [Phaeovulum veldkampii]